MQKTFTAEIWKKSSVATSFWLNIYANFAGETISERFQFLREDNEAWFDIVYNSATMAIRPGTSSGFSYISVQKL